MIADVGVGPGDEEDPLVVKEVGAGHVADHSVGHQQAVGRTEQHAQVFHDRRRRLGEAEPDVRGFGVHEAAQGGAEDGDGVVGGDQGEGAALAGSKSA
jgi:hypothetical protein